MLSPKLLKALNKQINDEYYSSYLYQAMVAYMEDVNLDGCAHWMRMQAEEEHLHAQKILGYLKDRRSRAELYAVKAPPRDWESPLAAFKAALEHEIHMTKNINALADLAQSENDHATDNLMQWYVTEQVEEEANVDAIVQKLEMVGGTGQGLFMIDNDLKSRPAPTPLPGMGGGAA